MYVTYKSTETISDISYDVMISSVIMAHSSIFMVSILVTMTNLVNYIC